MNSEERSDEDERHCLHFYENDQHYAHEGPHEIASWREVVSLRSALAAALARIAAVEARAGYESSALNEFYRHGFNNAMAQIRSALAASPTPTGPNKPATEPKRCAGQLSPCRCELIDGHDGACQCEHTRPATPTEPTEQGDVK